MNATETWTALQNPEDIASNYWRIRFVNAPKGSLHGFCGERRARLAAAAPELLEALKDMIGLLNDAGREDEDQWQPGQSWIFTEDKIAAKNRIKAARAVIAKAEGGAE